MEYFRSGLGFQGKNSLYLAELPRTTELALPRGLYAAFNGVTRFRSAVKTISFRCRTRSSDDVVLLGKLSTQLAS